MIENFNTWLSERPALYENYWMWVSILGTIGAIGWAIYMGRRAFNTQDDYWPLVLQARGQFVVALMTIVALSSAGLVGFWAVEDKVELRREYTLLMLLTVITGYALLMVVLWIAYLIADRKARGL